LEEKVAELDEQLGDKLQEIASKNTMRFTCTCDRTKYIPCTIDLSEEENYFTCPECGAVLEIMSCHWYNTIDGHAKNTIFHCNACHNDWEKDEEYVAQPVKFSRKFWG
jgi:transcription elongation factor Elf1